MKISPIAPALYIAAMATLFITLILHIIGSPMMDPFISIIMYLLLTEASKFVATYTLEEDDGTDS